MNLGEYVTQKAVLVGQEAIDHVRAGRIKTMGELEEFVHKGLGQTSADLLSLVSGSQSPLVQSLVASVEPTITQMVSDYLPSFAAITGGMLALSVMLGVWVSTETHDYRRSKRRSSR